jgi:hypothetical protein
MPLFFLILLLLQRHFHFHVVLNKAGINVPSMLNLQSSTCSGCKVDRGLVQVRDQLTPFREVELLIDINPGEGFPNFILNKLHIINPMFALAYALRSGFTLSLLVPFTPPTR